MTLTRQLNGLFFITATQLCVIFMVYSARNAYEQSLDSISKLAFAQVAAQQQLQYEIYQQDEVSLALTLQEFLQDEAVVAVAAYDSAGQPVASAKSPDREPLNIPRLRLQRAGLGTSDMRVLSLNEHEQAVGTGFYASLFARETSILLSIPVLTAIDPTQSNLAPEDFAAGLLARGENRSRLVIGYLSIGLDRGTLLARAGDRALHTFLLMLGVLAISGLLLRLAILRIIDPITRLKQIAHALANGEDETKISTPDHGEFADIAKALSSFKKSASRKTSEMSYEKNMFKLRVEQTEEELTARDQELERISDEYAASRANVRKLSNFDRLTELPNRELFIEHVRQLIRLAERSEETAALLCVSLVNFERITESLGRNTGDQLLKAVAARLLGCLRSSDLLGHYRSDAQRINVSRLGADEFAAVLNRLDDRQSAKDIAERISALLAKPYTIEGRELTVKPVIGIAVMPDDTRDAGTLLRFASAAKQQAAAAGASSVIPYSDNIELLGDEDFQLSTALRKALAENTLTLHYQPQVDTVLGSITGLEAFLRWQHPDLGAVSPERFIPLAEENGLIVELGYWALEEACRQICAFKKRAITMPRVALNISPQQLNPAFVTRLSETLKRYSLPASSLELGLTHEVIANNSDSMLQVLRELKDSGVHIALENFGVAPSTLAGIQACPLDDLKIERSFIAHCDKRTEGARMVSAVVAVANSLGLTPVAEGVERVEEFEYLSAQGVRLMRGYLFSKPMPAEELGRILTAPWHYMTLIQEIGGVAKRA
ncbi:MAG: bifunctional diguanylate cyclase/phosphodiesterase [Pseudomonadota bacterium]